MNRRKIAQVARDINAAKYIVSITLWMARLETDRAVSQERWNKACIWPANSDFFLYVTVFTLFLCLVNPLALLCLELSSSLCQHPVPCLGTKRPEARLGNCARRDNNLLLIFSLGVYSALQGLERALDAVG